MAATKQPSLGDQVTVLGDRVTTLENQMEEVLARPAFRRKTERGVCTVGNDPSSECPVASLGKFQGGCHGDACHVKMTEYYQLYRARKRAEKDRAANTPSALVIELQTKRAAKGAAPKAAPPKVKRVAKKAAVSKEAPAPARRAVKRRAD